MLQSKGRIVVLCFASPICNALLMLTTLLLTFWLERCDLCAHSVPAFPRALKQATMAGGGFILEDVAVAFCSVLQTTCLLSVKNQQGLRAISRIWSWRVRSVQDGCAEQRRRVLGSDLCVLLWRYTDRVLRYSPTPFCYHVELLVRSFLRYAQSGVQGHAPSEVTIAGSVGTALLMNDLGMPRAWVPTDIDMFVRDRCELDRIQSAFRIGVLESLGWSCEETECHTYVPDFGTHSRADESENIVITADDKEGCACLRRTLPLVQAPCPSVHSRFVRAVMIRPNIPRRYESMPELIYLVRPLNVTVLEFDDAPSEAVPFAELVRLGFDMAQCAVSVYVTEDLKFQCYCSDLTMQAVREQRIVLQRESALCSTVPGSIRRVLQRVRKYREYGFEIAAQ